MEATKIDYNSLSIEGLKSLLAEIIEGIETLIALEMYKQVEAAKIRAEKIKALIQERQKQSVAVEGQEPKKRILHPSSLKSQMMNAPPIIKTKAETIVIVKEEVERVVKNIPFDFNDMKRFRRLVTNLQVQLKTWMLIKDDNKNYYRAKHKQLAIDNVKLIVTHIEQRAKNERWKRLLLLETTYSSGYKKKRFGFDIDKILKDFKLN
jgi:hypothetical protein